MTVVNQLLDRRAGVVTLSTLVILQATTASPAPETQEGKRM
jgi:hypothetical protein